MKAMNPGIEIPEKIAHYEVLGIVGEGAMGVVLLAHDPFFDRHVAIKTAHLTTRDDRAATLARRMVLNEARAAGVLDHGAILQVFDAGEHEGEPFVVMEYVPQAQTLREFTTHPDLLPVDRVSTIIHCCARALDYAHRKGVIHRDIKASNMLLNRHGKVKIGDFGIAKLESEEVTEVLATMGSPRYMSPEQILDQPLTASTDLYSLGVVMYELLSGHGAFEARRFSQLTTKILTQPPRPLDEIRVDLPPELVALVHRAIEKRAADRFASGQEMASAIARVYPFLEQSVDSLDEQRRFEMLRGLEFFVEFSDANLREIGRVAHWKRFQPEQRVLREGDMGQSFHVIVSGEVGLYKGGARIAILTKGQCFGELGYLTRTPRSASVRSRDDTVTVSMDPGDISPLSVTCQMRFRDAFARAVAERLASTTERLSKYLQRPDR